LNWYLEVLRKYAVFSGRARRAEYWFFVLINALISGALGLIEWITGLAPNTESSVLAGIYSLAVLIPAIAVTIRRLHDTGRSGWWMLLVFIPCIGLILLFFLIQDSEQGGNQYGPNPKGIGNLKY